MDGLKQSYIPLNGLNAVIDSQPLSLKIMTQEQYEKLIKINRALIILAWLIAIGFVIWFVLVAPNVSGFEYHAIGESAYTEQKPNTERIMATVYAYNPLSGQTDSTPFITAYNEPVKEMTVANNCLSKGTKVVIEGKEYEVADRMNLRYGCEIYDVFFFGESEAVEWGKKNLEVEIIKL